MTQPSITVPPFPASAVEQACQVLADAVTGSQIPNLVAPLKVAEQPGEQQNTKWKRLFHAAAERQNRQHDRRPLLRLLSEVMVPVRFASPADFDSTRAQMTERLLLSWFQVLADGRIQRARPTAPWRRRSSPPMTCAPSLPAWTCTRTCLRSAVLRSERGWILRPTSARVDAGAGLAVHA